jgi:hypothetical protein
VSVLSQNRALTRIFGSKGKEVTEERSKMHNETLHGFRFSTQVIRVLKSRRMS